jgi:MraZ protein
MFLGEYQRTIDNKGRLFIPTKFRDNLSQGIAIISKGFGERCLFLFSREGWDIFNSRFSSCLGYQIKCTDAARWFFSSANEENIDQQGRVKIQQNLLESAGFKKEVV